MTDAYGASNDHGPRL